MTLARASNTQFYSRRVRKPLLHKNKVDRLGERLRMFQRKCFDHVCNFFFTIFDFFSALATVVEEYVRAANSPGAVPVMQSAWDVFTRTKCTQTLNDAKAVYE